jgi:hypothetical protein
MVRRKVILFMEMALWKWLYIIILTIVVPLKIRGVEMVASKRKRRHRRHLTEGGALPRRTKGS